MSSTATKTAEDATKNLPTPGGALSTVDPAKNDVTGGRKDPEIAKPTKEKKDSSLRINIELDLEVEVHLTARVKGDITIGLL